MEYEVGQELRVYRRTHRRTDEYKGKVIKVARKYVTVRYSLYQDGSFSHEREFEMATGQERNSTTTYGYSVKTLEQVELAAREKVARETLKSVGLAPISSLSNGRKDITLEQLEALAQLITTHPAFAAEV